MRQDADPVAIIEAAYKFDEDLQSWLGQLGRAALPAFDRGLGLLAFSFDASDIHHVVCSEQVPIGAATEEMARNATAMNAEVPSEILAHVLLSLAGYGTASELSGLGEGFRDDPFYKKYAHPVGMYDFLGVIGLNPPGTGVAVGTPLRDVSTTTPAERNLWTKIAAHIAAAARLREVAFDDRSEGSPLEDAEAILAPNGRIEHATGQASGKHARQELSVAVRGIESARGPLRRRDPLEALERWPSLLGRRWTIHGTQDSDGKRFLVARVNNPRPEKLAQMSLPERQVAWYCAQDHSEELIAYELGMQPEEVVVHLRSLAQEFGVERREELGPLLRTLIFSPESE
jgi:DNA-binding CsgD family transcriptional regulator